MKCHGRHCRIKVSKSEEYVKTEKVEPKLEKELPSESAVETELNEADRFVFTKRIRFIVGVLLMSFECFCL